MLDMAPCVDPIVPPLAIAALTISANNITPRFVAQIRIAQLPARLHWSRAPPIPRFSGRTLSPSSNTFFYMRVVIDVALADPGFSLSRRPPEFGGFPQDAVIVTIRRRDCNRNRADGVSHATLAAQGSSGQG